MSTKSKQQVKKTATKAETFSPFDPADYLNSQGDFEAYLQACLDEDPGDGSLVRAALADIIRAKNVSELARDTGLSREGIYKATSPNGNPTFSTMMKLTHALGLQLTVSAKQT